MLGTAAPARTQRHEREHAHGMAADRRALGAEASPLNDAYVSTYEIIQTWPHDPTAFTQGLGFDADGNLYESDGLYHHSAVRAVDVRTGTSKTKTDNDARHFGEGIEIIGNRMLQLTWKENVIHEYALPSLARTTTYELPCKPYCHEGWGLTYDSVAHKLYMSDGTDKLFTLNPDDLTAKEAHSKQIYDGRLGRPIFGVNELEWVDGELWGHVYPMYQHSGSECIVRINATDASVIGWIDMRGLLDKQREQVRRSPTSLVLNGIAYHPTSGRLYVTGKHWDNMYQVRIKPEERSKQTAEFVTSVCALAPLQRLPRLSSQGLSPGW